MWTEMTLDFVFALKCTKELRSFEILVLVRIVGRLRSNRKVGKWGSGVDEKQFDPNHSNDFFTMTGRAVEDPDFMLEALRRNFLSEAQHPLEKGGTRRMPVLVCCVYSNFEAARVHAVLV